jgi:hypothetical protein
MSEAAGATLAVLVTVAEVYGIYRWGVLGLLRRMSDGLRRVVERVLDGPRDTRTLTERLFDDMAADPAVSIEDLILAAEREAARRS